MQVLWHYLIFVLSTAIAALVPKEKVAVVLQRQSYLSAGLDRNAVKCGQSGESPIAARQISLRLEVLVETIT